jgi:hypothetical protein
MPSYLHCGKASLDSFANHQQIARCSKADHTAAAGSKHHSHRHDRGFAAG